MQIDHYTSTKTDHQARRKKQVPALAGRTAAKPVETEASGLSRGDFRRIVLDMIG